MISSDIEIINKLGLHARASAKLVKLVSGFESQIHIGSDGKIVNAKSIMGIMMLAAAKGTQITLTTEGSDEQQAHQAVLDLINNRFDEDE